MSRWQIGWHHVGQQLLQPALLSVPAGGPEEVWDCQHTQGTEPSWGCAVPAQWLHLWHLPTVRSGLPEQDWAVWFPSAAQERGSATCGHDSAISAGSPPDWGCCAPGEEAMQAFQRDYSCLALYCQPWSSTEHLLAEAEKQPHTVTFFAHLLLPVPFTASWECYAFIVLCSSYKAAMWSEHGVWFGKENVQMPYWHLCLLQAGTNGCKTALFQWRAYVLILAVPCICLIPFSH